MYFNNYAYIDILASTIHTIYRYVLGFSGFYHLYNLLPTRSEEREVLGVGSIPVAIFPSWQDTISLHFNCINMNIIG